MTPVLLVHGYLESGRRFARMADALRANGRDVHLFSYLPNDGSVGIDQTAEQLARFADVFVISPGAVVLAPSLGDPSARSAALADVAIALREEGALPAWRDELYEIAMDFGAPPLFHIERGAARYFGLHTFAAHVNGTVDADDATTIWLARRSVTKAVDPGLFDNLVGGGIAAGLSIEATVIKESWEEAGIEEALARAAIPVGAVHVRRPMFDGLQRETLFVHDLALPAGCSSVRYGDPEAEETVNIDWGSTDLQSFSKKMVKSLIDSPQLAYLAGPAKGDDLRVITYMGGVRNETSEHINTDAVTDSIRTELLQSGRFRFVADTHGQDEIGEQVRFQQETGRVRRSTVAV